MIQDVVVVGVKELIHGPSYNSFENSLNLRKNINIQLHSRIYYTFYKYIIQSMILNDKYILTVLVVFYVTLQIQINKIEACSRMKFMNPLELEDIDKGNASFSKEFRTTLGEGIDKIIESEIHKFEKIKTKKSLKLVLEDLMGYGITNPCIVLGILNANLTSTYIYMCVHKTVGINNNNITNLLQ